MHHIEGDGLIAFKHYYETNISSLIRFACRFVSSEIAEDIVHDVFLEIWERIDSFDEMPNRSYLFMSVRNRCLNYLKKEEVEATYIQSAQLENKILGLEYYESFEKLLIEQENLQELYDQIEQLPDKCRRIFKMAYFEERKSAEIAERLDLSIRTVEHQLYLGLKTLREKMLPARKKNKKILFFF